MDRLNFEIDEIFIKNEPTTDQLETITNNNNANNKDGHEIGQQGLFSNKMKITKKSPIQNQKICGQIILADNQNLFLFCKYCEEIFTDFDNFKNHLFNEHINRCGIPLAAKIDCDVKLSNAQSSYDDPQAFDSDFNIDYNLDSENEVNIEDEPPIVDTVGDLKLGKKLGRKKSQEITCNGSSDKLTPSKTKLKNGKFQCPSCHRSYGRFSALEHHAKTHLGKAKRCAQLRDNIKCEHCPKIISFKGNFRRHIKRCHPEINSSDISNGVGITVNDQDESSSDVQKNITPITYSDLTKESTYRSGYFYCPICSIKFTAFDRLKGHYRLKHVNLDEKLIESDDSNESINRGESNSNIMLNKILQCDKCDYKVLYKSQLLLHKLKHYNENGAAVDSTQPNPVECDYCSQVFMHRQSLNRHIRMFHNETPVDRRSSNDNKVTKRFKCSDCYRSFRRKFLLKEHLPRCDKMKFNNLISKNNEIIN